MINLQKIKNIIYRDCKKLGLINLGIILSIIVWGSLLRTYQLNSFGILFSDAGRDLLVASQSLKTKQIPLLGIPSSIPEFKQGPLSIWIQMLVMALGGEKYIFLALTFSALSIMSLIGLYELLSNTLTKQSFKIGVLATLILATSPLAIANARVPYHTTPIPLATIIFLWFNYRWFKNKHGIFLAVLSWCFLFQFELATLPLLGIFGYYYLRNKQYPSFNEIKQSLIALIIGLSPQIIYDLTHQFKQLGLFIAWTGYRLASFLVPTTSHSFNLNRLFYTFRQFSKYGTRIFSHDNYWIAAYFLLLTFGSAFLTWKNHKTKKMPTIIEISWISTLLLTLAFFVHSSPSEAYFPPFFILIPILISYGTSLLSLPIKNVIFTLIICIALVNSFQLFRHNFLVSTSFNFNYGASVGEQKQILNDIKNLTGQGYQLKTTREAGKFESYFNNFDFIGKTEFNIKQNNNGKRFYIESKDSALVNYPNSKNIRYQSQVMVFFE